jgi:hypothetical protein
LNRSVVDFGGLWIFTYSTDLFKIETIFTHYYHNSTTSSLQKYFSMANVWQIMLDFANTELVLARNTLAQLREQRNALVGDNQDIFDQLAVAQAAITRAYDNRDAAAMDAAVAMEERIMNDHDAIFGGIDQEISEATQDMREARERFHQACNDLEDEEARTEGRGPAR